MRTPLRPLILASIFATAAWTLRGADTPSPPAPAATDANATPAPAATQPSGKLAPKPLFRDPVYDGAADPSIIYNPADKKWYMFYTNRRANVAGLNGVAWIHGTPIGIATSADGGATWKYEGIATINYKDAAPDATWWAPALAASGGQFHMFLSYVPGTFSDGWNHPREIIHLTSKDLYHWDYQSTLPLSAQKVIDAGLLKLRDGTWRLWYKNEADGSSTHYADSKDLFTWTNGGRVRGLSDIGGEAANPFYWKGQYWLMRDLHGRGIGLYRSTDAVEWQRAGTLLQGRGTGPDDGAVGHHTEVLLANGRAFMFYFTHPGASGNSAAENPNRPSTLHVTELKYDAGNNTLTCDRDAPTFIELVPPADPETLAKTEYN